MCASNERRRPASRREFLISGGSCVAHVALASLASGVLARRAWAAPRGVVVAAEPFGRLERVAEGIWALVSTPLNGDNTTVSNGGLIAGRNGVLAIEGFMTPAGARWLGEQSRQLTGMWPSHVVMTHYHADHANGLAGYAGDGGHVRVHVTGVTRDLVSTRNQPADPLRASALGAAELLHAREATTIDLGGRVVHVVPRGGHTASDVTVEVEDPSVVFCGDLVWHGMFPNYVDAQPLALAASVASLTRSRATRYVPGHGGVGGAPDLQRYRDLLAAVEEAARRAVGQGTPLADAAAAWKPPASLGEWTLFSPTFVPRAFEAWRRELQARQDG